MVAFARFVFVATLTGAPVACLAGAVPQASTQAQIPPSNVLAPRDMSTGMAAGKRMHKPVTITKEWSDRAVASADCTAMHGALGSENGKLACVVDVDNEGEADAICGKAVAAGAVCER
jgi:uncharacterized glyoxalase superfamily protein PhnB